MREELLPRLHLPQRLQGGDAAEARVLGRHVAAVGPEGVVGLVRQGGAVAGGVRARKGDVDEGGAVGVAPVDVDLKKRVQLITGGGGKSVRFLSFSIIYRYTVLYLLNVDDDGYSFCALV